MSRGHKLPEALKDRLRVRPRIMGQILELATFYRRSIESLDKSSAQHKPVVNMRIAESSRSLMCARIIQSFGGGGEVEMCAAASTASHR
jgi:hypothetical protein